MQRYRVTKAVTQHGHYFQVGDVVENDGSLARLFGWVKVDGPVSQPVDDLAGLSKAELLGVAEERGVEVPAKILKPNLRELLES